jgi:WXG100 family type VII secretion target
MGSNYGAGYTTDTDVMSSAASYVTQCGQNMTSAVESLMAELENLPTAWQGPAASAYYGDGHTEGAVGHWHRKHRELMDACAAIADALNQSARGYDTTDDDNLTAARNATPY